jgi:SAM-dependent methyltransferase
MNRDLNDYNPIAGTYNRRYAINPLRGVAEALRDLIAKAEARRVLEVGCGTGYWLESVSPYIDRAFGLDPSVEMLRHALNRKGRISLMCGSAEFLPFAEHTFDLIYVVNALHHFGDKPGFIAQAHNLLKPRGTLAIIGLDVPSAIGHWVIYDYFPGALEYDQSRIPLWEQVESWIRQAGFAAQQPRTIEHISYQKRGRTILDDHFIQRHGTSQFMGLTDSQYQAGIDRIRATLAKAEARGEEAVFRSEIQLKMAVGRVQS